MTSQAHTETRHGKPWTEEEDAELLSKASAYGVGGAAVHMGRPAGGGYKRYRKLTKEE